MIGKPSNLPLVLLFLYKQRREASYVLCLEERSAKPLERRKHRSKNACSTLTRLLRHSPAKKEKEEERVDQDRLESDYYEVTEEKQRNKKQESVTREEEKGTIGKKLSRKQLRIYSRRADEQSSSFDRGCSSAVELKLQLTAAWEEPSKEVKKDEVYVRR